MASALCAATLAALCAATPRHAYAEPTTETEQKQTVEVDTSDVEMMISQVNADNNTNSLNEQKTLTSIDTTLNKLNDKIKEPNKGRSETDYLSSIEDKLSLVVGNTSQEQSLEQSPLNHNRGSIALVAYSNVPNSGTYYNYASGYLQQMSYGDDYVFLQDTSSSYVLAFGQLSQVDTNTISGQNLKFCRWYYSNNNVGYLMETGQSDMTITTNNHVVLSSLPKWPNMVTANDEQLRKEVGFYALVCVACSVFRDVWSFLVRMRSVSVPDGGKG